MTNDEAISKVGWNFDNSYARLSNLFYTIQNPERVKEPEVILFNHSLAQSLGLNGEKLETDWAALCAGNKIPTGARPLAQAYAGHQFGNFTMLGDGRAILLGEQITPSDERFDIQLKGSGKTPYSRGGDGRATLGPMLREYIISEAMHALGIPTTRGLAVVTTGEPVVRETLLPGAILTRVSSSHIRVGTFEYITNWGTKEQLRELADYTINRHFSFVKESENKYVAFLQEVIKRQAEIIAKWQLVGFIHGVMNTDNMTLSGETIDYGPCAFMDVYDPKTVFSSIDIQGRYSYGNQPNIGGWNLSRFARTLIPLLDEDKEKSIQLAQDSIDDYGKWFQNYWLAGMRAKLGLFNVEKEDEKLIEDLLRLMKENKADYTNTFRALTLGTYDEEDLFNGEALMDWINQWKSRLERQPESNKSIKKLMKENNPAIIPRNFRVEEALEAAVKRRDLSVAKRLVNVLSKPYAYTKDQEEYSKLPLQSDPTYQTFCGT